MQLVRWYGGKEYDHSMMMQLCHTINKQGISVAAASRVLPSFLAIACGSSLQRVQQEAHPPSESAIHTYMLIYSCGSILQAAKAIQQAACWSVLADGGRFRGKENVATLAVASNGTCVVLGCPTVPDNYAKVWDAGVKITISCH
jgi:hypothetical protein